ncbi:histone-like nucleoid-structuring protein Lsr2 [Mycolicibacterium palauense]|uniref:histone-like nucleoid-structuring protein Lsr2 n=1 Tax=Mycolicibacterium palauense TaxID=2034511 RepID=UPI000BFF17BD|nr:Lsr2 family protein [Mycolicibacterium palauense]
MAERIVRQLIDDLDGTEIPDGGGERVDFSLRGVDYQIDLSEANIAKLEKSLKPYIDAAAKLRSSNGRRSNGNGHHNGKASKEQLAAIREWARKQGYEVSDRGRVKTSVLRAFEDAH